MEKTRINLDILLPEVPDERDECVARIIALLQNKRGIDRVHVIPEEGNKKAQLCFHYDPSEVSLNKVEQLAKKAGAEITEHYGHLLVDTTGVRHPRHARIIETELRRQPGIQTVSVSGTGFIQLEFHKDITSEESIVDRIKKIGLRINNVEDFHAHEHKEIKLQEKE